MRKTIAAAVLTGSVVFGMAGIAGVDAAGAASSSGSSGAGSSTTKTFNCARLTTIESHVKKLEKKASSQIKKAKAEEKTDNSKGQKTQASTLAKRIKTEQAKEKRVNSRLASAKSSCANSGTSSTGSSSTNSSGGTNSANL
jgi:hypothetical protein